MKVAVVAIGNEVLAGVTVNGNAALLGRALWRIGLGPSSHHVLSDDLEGLPAALSKLCTENDLVVCTGGLGPTGDDITRQAVAQLVGCELTYNEEVARHLTERWGDQFSTLKDQATIPEKATPLHNRVGTAPGLRFELPGCELILLPGVPVEMEAMLREQVVPYLADRFAASRPNQAIVHFFQIPEADIDPFVRAQAATHPDVEFGIYPRLGLVTVRLSSDSISHDTLVKIASEIAAQFPHHTFPSDVETIEEAVHHRCLNQGLTLSAAESCTGGALAARLTSLSGASGYFLGSCVTYSNALKEKLVGVRRATLEECGAVSEEVVNEMVSGVMELTESSIGVAISGIAGPEGGTEEKPVGTVWIAVARQGQPPIASLVHAKGNRAAVVARSVNFSLSEVWKLIR